jgi:hypothetical protein
MGVEAQEPAVLMTEVVYGPRFEARGTRKHEEVL